jgi:hypothetical protein
MVFVKTNLVSNPQPDQYCYTHTNGKSPDINERREFVFNQISPGRFEIVL